MDSYIIALKYLDSLRPSTATDSLYGVIYQHISDLFSECDKYESAKETYLQSLEYSIRADDSITIASCYRKIGNMCYYLSETENPDTLLFYMQKSIPYAKDEDPYYSAFYMALIGIYKDKTDIAGFIPERPKGITLLPNGFDERQPFLNNYIAWFLWMIGETEQAISYAKQNVESDNLIQQIDALGMLSKVYLEIGDTTAAIISVHRHDSLSQLLVEAKRKAACIEKQLRQYEDEKEQKWEKELSENSIKIVIWILSLMFLLLVTTISLVLGKKRKTSKIQSVSSFLERFELLENSDICKRITTRCDSEPYLTASNVAASMICLTQSDWKELEKTYEQCFNGCIEKILHQYPNLNEGELHYYMLSLFDLSEVQKAALLGLSYQGSISRRNRVQNKTGVDNLHEDIINLFKNILKT